jgi:hypothetical protein
MVCFCGSCIGIDCGVSHMVYRVCGAMQGWVSCAAAQSVLAGLAPVTKLHDCLRASVGGNDFGCGSMHTT